MKVDVELLPASHISLFHSLVMEQLKLGVILFFRKCKFASRRRSRSIEDVLVFNNETRTSSKIDGVVKLTTILSNFGTLFIGIGAIMGSFVFKGSVGDQRLERREERLEKREKFIEEHFEKREKFLEDYINMRVEMAIAQLKQKGTDSKCSNYFSV